MSICTTERQGYGSWVLYNLKSPQGGVLSPMLFNIIMDKIARHSFPQGTEIIIYANDILIQCDSPRTLTTGLRHFENFCVHMGLIINATETKFQSSLNGVAPHISMLSS